MINFYIVYTIVSDPARSKALVNFFFNQNDIILIKKTKVNGSQPGFKTMVYTNYLFFCFFIQPKKIMKT
jgi:hypothetical protein